MILVRDWHLGPPVGRRHLHWPQPQVQAHGLRQEKVSSIALCWKTVVQSANSTYSFVPLIKCNPTNDNDEKIQVAHVQCTFNARQVSALYAFPENV